MGEIRGDIVSRSIKDITPLGVRFDESTRLSSWVAKDTATDLETVNMFQKIDGTLEWDSKVVRLLLKETLSP